MLRIWKTEEVGCSDSLSFDLEVQTGARGFSKFRTSERARSAERDARTNNQTATSYMERGNSTFLIITAFIYQQEKFTSPNIDLKRNRVSAYWQSAEGFRNWEGHLGGELVG